MLNTALDDGMIKRNPCRIPGAGDDKSAERPVLTIDEVLRVVDAMPPRLRMMVLLATFTSLRFGELAALARRNVDVSTGFVTVVENQAQLSNGELYLKDPKSAAGRRAVPVPDDLLDELKQHLAEYAEQGGRSGLHRTKGRQASPPELPEDLGQGASVLRRTPGALPRSPAHREPVRGGR
jgi:integrase